MHTTVLAYVIAVFGAWGLFDLNNALDIALTDEAIVFDRRRLCNDRSRASPDLPHHRRGSHAQIVTASDFEMPMGTTVKFTMLEGLD